MEESEEFKSIRRLALASLGRNVLHFHRLETELKRLKDLCEFQSPSGSTANEPGKRTRPKSMGLVVSELHEHLYKKPNLAGPSVRLQFRVTAPPEYIAKQKAKLAALVNERNQLIHHDLSKFNPTSEQSCRRWITRLDKQNERILMEIKVARQLVDTIGEMLAALTCRSFEGKIQSG